jgi:hypothetical protein
MFNHITLRRQYGALIAATILSGCVTVKLPEPTVTLLKPNVKYFIDIIEIDSDTKVESKTIQGHIQNALETLTAVEKPTGTAMTLRVSITNVHDVSPGEALFIGGANSINANFSLIDPKTKKTMFEIPLDARSANYAPGGIIGMIAEASSDDEPKLAKVMIEKMRQWVLIEQNLSIKSGVVLTSAQIAPAKETNSDVATKPNSKNKQENGDKLEAKSATKIVVENKLEIERKSDEQPRKDAFTGNRRLNNLEITAVFSDIFIGNYPGEWGIDFAANGKWEGIKSTWNQTFGYGTWAAKGDMHCYKIIDLDTKGYENLNETGGCYEVWLDAASAKLSMIDPKQRSKPIVVKEKAYVEIERVNSASIQ